MLVSNYYDLPKVNLKKKSQIILCLYLIKIDTGGPTCWDRIFQAFLLYRNTYRPDTLLNQQAQTSFSGSPSPSSIKTIAPKEVTALIAVLSLIEVIAAQVNQSDSTFFFYIRFFLG
jgi:hypothetical protein